MLANLDFLLEFLSLSCDGNFCHLGILQAVQFCDKLIITACYGDLSFAKESLRTSDSQPVSHAVDVVEPGGDQVDLQDARVVKSDLP